MIVGRYEYSATKFNRDELMQRIMSTVAEFVQLRKIPWDPFNIELIVKAQNESKPKKQNPHYPPWSGIYLED